MKKILLITVLACTTIAVATALYRYDNILAGEPVEVIPDYVETNPAKVALGKKMFNDTRISLDNTISCATCHVLEDGGADHADERVSEGINGLQGTVNSPTVFNAVFNIDQFWNGRAHTLAEQAAAPPINPVEMGDQTWEQIIERLCQDASLVAEFKAIYPEEGLTEATVTDAIEEYEKTLITPNDKLDRYLKGDKNAMSAEELAGYQAFKANDCATCHYGKTLGGQSFELMSKYGDYFADRKQSRPDIAYNDDDNGLYSFTGKAEDMHKFKVPNLRNISKTAPYYHDGTIESLEEAVRLMFHYELGKTVTDEQVASITTFLKALDGESEYFE
ncbi:MAG: cytochrome c peroxidase [Bacteroidales bacterium]|nr:cytochrome c peroxidase [Bacteroidales bacterium]